MDRKRYLSSLEEEVGGQPLRNKAGGGGLTLPTEKNEGEDIRTIKPKIEYPHPTSY